MSFRVIVHSTYLEVHQLSPRDSLAHKMARETSGAPVVRKFKKNFCDSGAEGRVTCVSETLQYYYHVM